MKRKISRELVKIMTAVVVCIGIWNFQMGYQRTAEGYNTSNEQISINEIEKLQEDMEYLTSHELKGRLTGTKGNVMAQEYIQKRFKEIGLLPFSRDGYTHGYEQEVYFPEKSSHSMKVIFKDGSQKVYEYGKDYMDQTRIKNMNVRCKVHFVGEEIEQNRGLNENIAILVDDKNMRREIYKIAPKVILRKREDFLAAPQLLDMERGFIQIKESVFKEMTEKEAEEVIIKSKYSTKVQNANNVVGMIPGSSKNKEKAIVISAHFDHVGWDGEAVFPGAIDNASGTCAIMDIAKELKAWNSNKNDIYISAFNGEEFGLYGSAAFAEFIKDKYDEIQVINLDCIGKIDGGDVGVHGEKKRVDHLKKLLCDGLTEEGIKCYKGEMPNTDHSSFMYDNMYAVSLVQKELFTKGKSIHTQDDTMEIVDFKEIKKVCNVVVKVIKYIEK